MADVAQDNIKEKVNSVREVVSGRSNNEIILVLQFYDYDVEKTIQAYVENGAKEALQEWQFSGTKPVKKKRNKKKPSASSQAPPAQSSAAPRSPETLYSESGSATSFMVNGDVPREPVVNGVLEHEQDESPTSEMISNGPTANTYHVPASSYPTPSSAAQGAGDSNHFDVTLPNTTVSQSESKAGTELKVGGNQGAKEKSPSPQPQRQNHANHHHHQHNRQRAHSGSHGHNDTRDRTTSTSSTDGKTGKKHAHLGLERSAKDLHRQTVSLERLCLIFNEEVERSSKRIKSVFDDVRNCLNAREAFLLGEVNSLKGAGAETFDMRQGLAHDLKVKIDRAERMNESELAELRLDIKHFVSDRKVDEDLAKTTRFLYDDTLKEHINKFGEVVPMKCQYIQRRGSVSSLASSVAASEPEQHIPKPTLDIPNTNVTDKNKKPSTPHLDASEAREVAQLQRRLKQSLTLEGIPVKQYPERAESAPVSSHSTARSNNESRPAGGRRDNRNRRRNDRDRPPRVDGPKDDNRVTFNQTPNGERVILIGRKTGPQSSARPPRGGRGRGGRGRGKGNVSDTNRGGNTDNVNPGENSGSTPGSGSGTSAAQSPSASRGQASSPIKALPQRENSGSPRRGTGRGRGQSGYNRRNNNSGSNNSSNLQPNNTGETKKEG